VRAYEAPALALLDKSPRPEAFAMKLGALSFPEKDRPGLVPVIVEIPGNTMAWAPERTGGSSHAQFAVVVRIKDAMGREADRLSQDYALSAATDKAPQVVRARCCSTASPICRRAATNRRSRGLRRDRPDRQHPQHPASRWSSRRRKGCGSRA
jgi:hypothetical protein